MKQALVLPAELYSMSHVLAAVVMVLSEVKLG